MSILSAACKFTILVNFLRRSAPSYASDYVLLVQYVLHIPLLPASGTYTNEVCMVGYRAYVVLSYRLAVSSTVSGARDNRISLFQSLLVTY